MTSSATAKASPAFTLIEMLVVVVIVVILLITAMPTHKGAKVKTSQAQCIDNLRQIGLGWNMYLGDHKDLFPWQVSTNQGGTEELISNGVVADHFAKLAPYQLGTRIFVCPEDKTRHAAATNSVGFSNTNLSYFAALNAALTVTSSPATLLLAGDRHLAFNHQPVKPGLFSLTNPAALSWTKELHWAKNQAETLGVMAFADGHCEAVKSTKLPATFQRQNPATRLVIP